MISGRRSIACGFLDLGHHGGAAADQFLGLKNILGALHEGERDPVDPGHQRGLEVGAVLWRHRGDGKVGIGQADALAIRHPAADHDPGDGALGGSFLRDQTHLAVVEQKRMAGPKRGQDFRMRKLHAGVVAGRLVGIEHEALAVVELDRALSERTEP